MTDTFEIPGVRDDRCKFFQLGKGIHRCFLRVVLVCTGHLSRRLIFLSKMKDLKHNSLVGMIEVTHEAKTDKSKRKHSLNSAGSEVTENCRTVSLKDVLLVVVN